jgi:predicted nucleic acid-binding protein
MEDFRLGRFRPVLSEVTAAEVLAASEPVRDLYAEILELGAEVLAVSRETLALRASDEARSVLGSRFENDMLHIAAATIAEVDALVSWNFRHIVRLDKIRLFNAVNIEQGYKALTIYSPQEVTIHGRDQSDQSS